LSGATVSAASNVGCANPYNTTTGGYASTTGNIYGIYDMSGGSWEYVMGNYGNYISSSGFSELPAAKYYDVYTTSEGTTACGGGICYGQAISETLNWNSDYYYPATSSGPWVVRGANFTGTTSAGIFSLSYKTGSVAGDTSTRIVVTME